MSSTDLYVPDCLFPTDNDLEIPVLRLDMQPEFCEIPFVCYGEQKRTFDLNYSGTLHFYTDDYRFSTVYEHPEKILQYHPNNIVEPNFSLFNDTPIAFGMQAVYKKRHVARMMQQKGIRVFVDLNVASKFYQINLLGVPKGYSSFCTRGYSDRLEQLNFELDMAKFIAEGNPIMFVVYGGGKICRDFCHENGLIYVNPIITIKNKYKSYQRMLKEGIALFDDGKKIPSLQSMLDRQVENFANYKQIERKEKI